MQYSLPLIAVLHACALCLTGEPWLRMCNLSCIALIFPQRRHSLLINSLMLWLYKVTFKCIKYDVLAERSHKIKDLKVEFSE